MEGPAAHRRLLELNRTRGAESRQLDLGAGRVRLEGLDAGLAVSLGRRWGAFLGRDDSAEPDYVVRVLRSDAGWLVAQRGEGYRIESFNDAADRLIASYNFALCADAAPSRLRLGLYESADEPLERAVENALRFVAARLALDRGGLALHGAGVLREERAYLFAGPSGSGKTTAVGLSPGTLPLGDDFAVIVLADPDRGDPAGRRWAAAALPFDNSERVVGDPPRGLFPLAGVWRLHKAADTRVERPPLHTATAALLGCAAFPWALPAHAGLLLERCQQLVEDGCFARLHFSREGDIWTELLR